MKMYIEDDHGRRYEIQKAAGLQAGDVILFANGVYRERDIERMERVLSEKIGRKVIVLDARFREIMSLPPVLEVPKETGKTDRQD